MPMWQLVSPLLTQEEAWLSQDGIRLGASQQLLLWRHSGRTSQGRSDCVLQGQMEETNVNWL